jgi:hypothetical protein
LSSDYASYSIVPRSKTGEVAVLAAPGGWALPGHNADEPWEAVKEIRAVLGLDTVVAGVVSEQTGPAGKSTLFAHELVGPDAALTAGARWISAADLDGLHLAGQDQGDMLTDWFSGVEQGTALPDVPWCRAGWFDEAAAWMAERLAEAGLAPGGPVEQFLTSPWSCTLRVPAGDGYAYLKAAPPAFSHEAVLTAMIGGWYPDNIVPIVAVDAERGWMLSGDIGDGTCVDPVTTDADLPAYQRSIEQYARIQRTALDHLPELRRLGLPDRSPDHLPVLFEEVLADTALLMVGEEGGLCAAEHDKLAGFLPGFRERCARLADFALPETLVNFDFWHGNVSFRDRGDIIFDWAESGIGHPMFSLTTVMREFEVQQVPDGDRLRQALADTYLAQWRDLEPAGRIAEAYELAWPGAILCRALTWRDSIASLTEPRRYRKHRRAVVINMSRMLPLIG